MPGLSGLEIKNPQEEYEYHWVINKPLSILKREAQGYEICTGNNKQALGDLILARIPKKLYEKRQQYEMAKPRIQARASFFESIEPSKAEQVYYKIFIEPTTFPFKLKKFIQKIISRIRGEKYD